MSEEQPPEPDRVEGYPHPRDTARLFGQDRAEAAFLDAWAGGHMHHAWLLRGPQGIGKATLAYRIARALIAQPMGGGLFGETAPPTTLDIPDDCAVQARISAQAEPRLFVLNRRWNPDTKRVPKQIVIDDVRTMRRFLGLSAADGGWRAVIVDSADEMNRSSANGILKFLEEPPANTVFLLISHAPAGLLPTIRSRCRTLDLGPLDRDALAAALEGAGAQAGADQAEAMAELSGGSAGLALRLLSGDGLALYARLVQMVHPLNGVNRADMVALAEHCAGRTAAGRYETTLSLIQMLVARLARSAATGIIPPAAAPGEPALLGALGSAPAQATLWAEAQARISATARHAVAVNLDPAQCVIDILLELDTTVGRARAMAA